MQRSPGVGSLQVNLTGQRALVTGGGRGIGRALALGLARSGADVAVVYHQHPEAAEQTAAEARAMGVRALAVQADTGDEASVQRMLQQVVEQFGELHILVNNAGTLSRVPFLDLPFAEWRRVMQTNLDGPFLVGQAVARHMIARGTRGCIVNVTSANQAVLAPNLTHYVVSKTGAWALTRQMAFEFGAYGIRVNALAPGSRKPTSIGLTWRMRIFATDGSAASRWTSSAKQRTRLAHCCTWSRRGPLCDLAARSSSTGVPCSWAPRPAPRRETRYDPRASALV